jgi:N-methylhydantoinase A
MRHWLGIDTGGTFTDFVLFDGKQLRIHKRLSTPEAPARAILEGIAALGIPVDQLQIVHGSTVATNAVLERKGVRTAYITNRGLGDVLTIGRQARRELYSLQPLGVEPPVPAALCLETGGRLGANGEVVDPLSEQDLDELAAQVRQLAPAAVAINLLFSFLDDRFERAIAARMPPGTFVARSSSVLPEYREYERGIATWINAWIGPLVADYLEALAQRIPANQLSIMQSSGDTAAATEAAQRAVHMLLSGPAGGMAGARWVGTLCGKQRLLTFDMGGTSTDVALIDDEVKLTTEGAVAGYPIAVPMVDIHTIGAGGGSIARVDAGGMLQVGPQSAGAKPGPACYGRGGTEPTVTDANLVLGRLLADSFLGGALRLDEHAARSAVATCAKSINLSIEQTALGIIQIANERMAQALRVMSMQRGVDPRVFTLLSFGGAAGLHVCALAETLEIDAALVPVQSGVLSALGMLVAPRGRQVSRTIALNLEQLDASRLAIELGQLESQARAALRGEGIADEDICISASTDLRYRGQSHALNLPWTRLEQLSGDFASAHQQRYGHCLNLPVELVNLRISARCAARPLSLPQHHQREPRPPLRQVTVYGNPLPVPVWQRDGLAVGQVVHGPALIVETVATTWIAPHWSCRCDGYGNLLLDRRKRGSATQ